MQILRRHVIFASALEYVFYVLKLKILALSLHERDSHPVAWSDTRPTGIQEVSGSILRSGNFLL